MEEARVVGNLRWRFENGRNRMGTRKHFLYLVLIFLLSYPSLVFCETGYFRSSPEAKDCTRAMKTLGILFIDLKVYEFTAGGVREPKDDWTEAARRNFSTSFEAELKERSLEAKVLGEDSDSEELDDVRTLYDAVRDAILTHTYGDASNWNFFPEKLNHFDYSLGPVDGLLTKLHVDGLLLVTAGDEVSTGGRKTLMVVGVLTGVQPRSGITWANAALVDGSGSILWFSANPGRTYDLREADEVSKLVGRMMNEFPAPKK
jgi:hypothetical protein